MILSLHHIQLAMPAGGENAAIAFYGGLLGLQPVEKPAVLRERGGVWFARGTLRLHLGVETPFRPARKAHPAFEVAALGETLAALDAAGVECRPGADIPGVARAFIDDPFGNRIELLECYSL